MQVQSLSQKEPLEEGMATHSSILAWKIPWTREEPGGLQTMGSQESDTTEGLSPKIKAQLSGTSLKVCFLAVT